MPPTKAALLEDGNSTAAPKKAPLVGAEGCLFAAAATRPFAAAAGSAATAAQSASPDDSSMLGLASTEQVGATGSTPAATSVPEASPNPKRPSTTVGQVCMEPGTHACTTSVGTKQAMSVADSKVVHTGTVTDRLPKAAAVNFEVKTDAGINAKTNMPKADFVPRDLKATGPSASSLARRAAHSQRTLGKRPHSAPTTRALAASNSLPATMSSSAGAQQQRSESPPSSPSPQQTSSLAAAASLQVCPGSGQPVKGNPDRQPVPMKGNANGQASGSAAAPVQHTLKEQLTSMKGKANSGLAVASAAAAAVAAVADQRQVAGTAVATPGGLITAVSSDTPIAGVEAADQDLGMMCGATSPTSLTKAAPKTQRRQLLQQDSCKRRKQACMVHLKAARLDAIKRLRHTVWACWVS